MSDMTTMTAPRNNNLDNAEGKQLMLVCPHCHEVTAMTLYLDNIGEGSEVSLFHCGSCDTDITADEIGDYLDTCRLALARWTATLAWVAQVPAFADESDE